MVSNSNIEITAIINTYNQVIVISVVNNEEANHDDGVTQNDNDNDVGGEAVKEIAAVEK